MKIAVVYKSHYGTTKQYATWIAKELKADLLEKSSMTAKELLNYDVIIYGGGLYASGIIGIDLVTKHPPKQLIVFTVGLSNPATTDFSEIIAKNLPLELKNTTKIFHLRGGINYRKLSILHRIMMAIKKKLSIGNKKYNELTDEEKSFVKTYGNEVDFTDKSTIYPIIDYVKLLCR